MVYKYTIKERRHFIGEFRKKTDEYGYYIDYIPYDPKLVIDWYVEKITEYESVELVSFFKWLCGEKHKVTKKSRSNIMARFSTKKLAEEYIKELNSHEHD